MICPTCKRKIPEAKVKQDKRITQDLGKVDAAMASCTSALSNPFFANIRGAVQDEMSRLDLARVDHRLLWAIYRRKEKGQPYYV